MGAIDRQSLVLSEEFIFIYKPGIELGRVLKAFGEFYAEYNGWGGDYVTSHEFDSGKAALLLAMSGGNTFDQVIMHFSDCGENTCRVMLLVLGTTVESTNNSYDQVKKFFAERAPELLQLEYWGEFTEAPTQAGEHHICQDCGSVILESNASYCWHCGAAQSSKVTGDLSTADLQKDQQGGPRRRLRSCMVCKLSFQEEDLLAWCPFCGAAAHRLHLLEFLHVKNNCPACGHHLDEQDLSAQLGRAHLRLPEKPHS